MGCRWTRSSISGFRLLGAPAGGSWLSDKVTSRAAEPCTLGLQLLAVVTGGSRFCGKLSSRAVWPSASGLRFLWAVAGSTRLGGKLTSRAACRDFGLAGGLGILFWRLATRWQTNVSPRFGIASYERAFDCAAHITRVTKVLTKTSIPQLKQTRVTKVLTKTSIPQLLQTRVTKVLT